MDQKRTTPPYRKATQNSHNSGKQKRKNLTARERQEKQGEVHQIRDELQEFARTDWGRQWVNAILEYGRPYRMQRGIRYAQEERISNLTISAGMIFATVQGTAPTPYRVKILFDTIPDDKWQAITMKMADKALYTIQLLENKLPHDLREIFIEEGAHLYPPPTPTLNATCSCPDGEVPCKHIAATILYVARVIDFDPFLLLQLRGRNRESILNEIKQARSCANEPFTKSVKKIREMVNIADFAFDVPLMQAQDVPPRQFLKSPQPYKIGFQFTKPPVNIETIDTLGILPNVESTAEFEQLFKDLYHSVIISMYKMALAIEGKQK